MEINEILTQVNGVFKKVFKHTNISVDMDTTAGDVQGWDSLNHTVMIVEVEKHFNMKFKLREVLGFSNVGDMVRLIHTRKNSN